MCISRVWITTIGHALFSNTHTPVSYAPLHQPLISHAVLLVQGDQHMLITLRGVSVSTSNRHWRNHAVVSVIIDFLITCSDARQPHRNSEYLPPSVIIHTTPHQRGFLPFRNIVNRPKWLNPCQGVRVRVPVELFPEGKRTREGICSGGCVRPQWMIHGYV